jgi:hypothetical protein
MESDEEDIIVVVPTFSESIRTEVGSELWLEARRTWFDYVQEAQSHYKITLFQFQIRWNEYEEGWLTIQAYKDPAQARVYIVEWNNNLNEGEEKQRPTMAFAFEEAAWDLADTYLHGSPVMARILIKVAPFDDPTFNNDDDDIYISEPDEYDTEE